MINCQTRRGLAARPAGWGLFRSADTHPAAYAARRAEGRRGWRQDQPRGHDRLVRRREGRNSKPRDDPGSLPLEAALCNCRRILRQASERHEIVGEQVQELVARLTGRPRSLPKRSMQVVLSSIALCSSSLELKSQFVGRFNERQVWMTALEGFQVAYLRWLRHHEIHCRVSQSRITPCSNR
jgi:hypothetical protein